MNDMKMINALFFVVCLICLFCPAEAYAYLNPGSGSDFFQLIMSFFAGILGGIKLCFKKITNIFRKNSDNNYE